MTHQIGTEIEHQGWTWTVANYFTHNGQRYMRLWSKKFRIATNVKVAA
jgi:hypothetical protein